MIELVYFGTSNHSVILLDELTKSNDISVKLVVTKPDKPVGRKHEIKPTPVKEWCITHNVPFITPSNLKLELENVMQMLTKYPTSLGLVADYGLMIPINILNHFEKGVVNIHFSLLPRYRGASPVAYAILNGEKETGITFLLTTPQMDKGDIIFQIPYPITTPETDESLYQKLFKIAGENAPTILSNYLEGKLTRNPQDETLATYCTPSGKLDRSTYLTKEDAKIDLTTKTPTQIERAIRAFYPWPVAWTTLGEIASYLHYNLRKESEENLRVKLLRSEISTSGELTFSELQVEGGKRLRFEDFKNGYFTKN